MKRIAVFVIDDVEEVECLTVVDFCRRADIDVTTVSVTGKREIHGSHDIVFETDALFDETEFDEFDGIVYPGGPGTGALGEVPGIHELAEKFLHEGKMVAAICAAPGMLAETGLLRGKSATGYPGCKPKGMATWLETPTAASENLITGRGPGCAPFFALEIIRFLCGDKTYAELYASTMTPVLF